MTNHISTVIDQNFSIPEFIKYVDRMNTFFKESLIEDDGKVSMLNLYVCAAREGRLDVIKHLYTIRRLTSDDMRLALKMAIKIDRMNIVKYMVKKIPDKQTALGQAIGIAAQSGSLKTLRYLVKKGGCPQIGNALELAIMHGHLPIVKYLCGLDYLNSHNKDYHKALIQAIEANQLPIIKYFVEVLRIDIKSQSFIKGHKKVLSARFNDDAGLVDYLINHKGDVSPVNNTRFDNDDIEYGLDCDTQYDFIYHYTYEG